jgi:hypothetical protein
MPILPQRAEAQALYRFGTVPRELAKGHADDFGKLLIADVMATEENVAGAAQWFPSEALTDGEKKQHVSRLRGPPNPPGDGCCKMHVCRLL